MTDTMISNGKVLTASAPMNLTANLTESLVGSVADFPVARSKVIFTNKDGGLENWDEREVIFREDTNKRLAIVSNRYGLVSNRECFHLVENAITEAGITDIRSGVSVVGDGRKFKALYVLPECSYEVGTDDTLCCTVLVTGSYDGTTRLMMEVGAYRFVCTNLSTGGGGILGGGFRVMHKGNLREELENVTPMILDILTTFPEKASLFSRWNEEAWDENALEFVTTSLTDENKGMKRHTTELGKRWETGLGGDPKSLWWAYNEGTNYATHEAKTVSVAYKVGDAVNNTFLDYWGAVLKDKTEDSPIEWN